MSKHKHSIASALSTSGAQTPPGSPIDMDFDEFIDAAADGSQRSRNIMSLMMTAAFIAALGWFNSLKPEFNWYRSRIQAMENAYHWVRFSNDGKDTTYVKIDGQKMLNRFTLAEFDNRFGKTLLNGSTDYAKMDSTWPKNICIKFPAFLIKKDSTIDFAGLDKKTLQSTLVYLGNSHHVHRAEMDNLLQVYNKGWVENALFIRVPILGLSFDVNWMAVISGLAFSILYFLLYHSLSRERKNLKLLFKLAKKRRYNRVDFYQLLSMEQVLTVPNSIDEFIVSNEKNRIITASLWSKLKYVLKLLITLVPIIVPLGILALILWYDYKTTDIGNSINQNLMIFHRELSIFVLVLNIVMCFVCVWEWYHVNHRWTKEAKKIKKLLTNHLHPKPQLLQE